MEAIFKKSSAHHQSMSPNKQIKNQSKKNTRGHVSRSTENLVPTNNNIRGGGGILFAPPHSLSFSYPPSSFSFSVPHPHQQIQKQSQPPLLPLPISRPHNSFPSSQTRDLSCPPTTRKTNRTRDHSLTPKKSKQAIPRREEPRKDTKPTETVPVSAKSFIIASTVPLGPDPNDLPKDVSKVLSSSSSPSSSLIAGNGVVPIGITDLDTLSCSLFALSPHPSSLPLPKFFMRPKLSCNAEAAGINAGATDNLRRLLRLR
ncbi:hypothetical protein P3X46_020760 [Hevea brasiliensis]|uniref:VQ domain-containing protein n=1 Tax=Hevea brasiliensis TaxID=3981 RepID=A0ABQ9LDD9_HEVBR|nr:uncharacterized protein LOC110655897 [Hevea brasiliensis]KAJ9165949.1 hypothetical protein P3X46_020760 [Hevea brasiliensis]